MRKKQIDKHVVQMVNSGKFTSDWDQFEEYCDENGLNARRVQGKPRVSKRSIDDDVNILPAEHTHA